MRKNFITFTLPLPTYQWNFFPQLGNFLSLAQLIISLFLFECLDSLKFQNSCFCKCKRGDTKIGLDTSKRKDLLMRTKDRLIIKKEEKKKREKNYMFS